MRIPISFAVEPGLEQLEANIAVVDRALVITPSHASALDELLARVTDDNLHGEIDSGIAVGHEVG
ncbi:MAG: AbrB/MazE/SpoVT family DNA-binding domain-containing protein [Thermoanaerobaculia bacterium]